MVLHEAGSLENDFVWCLFCDMYRGGIYCIALAFCVWCEEDFRPFVSLFNLARGRLTKSISTKKHIIVEPS